MIRNARYRASKFVSVFERFFFFSRLILYGNGIECDFLKWFITKITNLLLSVFICRCDEENIWNFSVDSGIESWIIKRCVWRKTRKWIKYLSSICLIKRNHVGTFRRNSSMRSNERINVDIYYSPVSTFAYVCDNSYRRLRALMCCHYKYNEEKQFEWQKLREIYFLCSNRSI